MPRIRRKGFERRGEDTPVGEMTNSELASEYKHLVTTPTEEPWEVLYRTGELRKELTNRFMARRKAGPLTEKEIKQWHGWLGDWAEWAARRDKCRE